MQTKERKEKKNKDLQSWKHTVVLERNKSFEARQKGCLHRNGVTNAQTMLEYH
jgi:hypothetical protein